ncbi:FIST signal transduction protein [Maribacter polysaccharolyticus]|uniref:FIST signal transduction protein n=1 Tax=Maribacter polysaccharolyticus TaxID=3020831 RepID=UPI00237F80D5|nr:FIST N-terminal domain-containing protein [Maribacter polysaccharolyticus]MDE3740431.1 FIST N-terminal domain-containing protein [Maribacter polysaccharolyticus]
MKAKSIHGTSVNDIQKTLDRTISDGFKPTLAIIFISIKQDRKAICQWLAAKDIDVFGATSSGEFINGIQTTGEIAILLLELPKTHYTILFEAIGERTLETATATLAHTALKQFTNPSLIVCSTGINQKQEFFKGEEMVNYLKEQLGPDKLFFGGMAGDDWTLKGSFVFTNSKETDDGLVALVLDGDKINLKGMAVTGWKPLGIKRTVTKSKGNLLYEIDGKPALELYLKYLGKEDKMTENNYNIFEEVSMEYPFIVERDANETVLKTPMRIDVKEKALVMDIPMSEGLNFWFTNPPEFDIVEEVIDKANQLKQDTGEQADALLVFSCAGRQPILGPLATEENEGLARVWNSPMAGFFTYGEFGRVLNGKQNFHSGACCWVTLKEKETNN